jgi:hypothetical protein
MKKIALIASLFASPVLAQMQSDPVKLAPIYQQQRNIEADARAQCFVIVGDLQVKIADLEKKLAEAQAAAK